MNRRLLAALCLIGVLVVVLVMNSGRVSVDLIFKTVTGVKSLVFLGFAAAGVVIGVLLK